MKVVHFNPWHHTPIGEDAPNVVTGLIEIPKGNRAKYELNKETGRLRLDRVIYSIHTLHDCL